MIFFVKLRKKLRAMCAMAKRKKMKGRSARHGRNPAPYTKYGKRPYPYSSEYRTWFYATRAKASKSNNKYADQNKAEKQV